MNTRNRTPSEYVCYSLYLYFSGLSLRRTSERLSCFIIRNHVSIWNWIQEYHPQKISSNRKRISEYVVDETILKVGSEYIWLWVAIEPDRKQADPRTNHIKGKKHVCCWKVSFRYCQRLWKPSSFNRRWNMVPNGL